MNDALTSAASGDLINSLRLVLFALGILAAALWTLARPRGAWLVLGLGSAAGLSYWLVQISPPFGLGADPGLTRLWAQAGVNAALGRSDLGYVWGTPGAHSIATTLAALGVSLDVVHRLPELGALLLLALIGSLPLLLIRNRTTAAFAGALAFAGLWPGQTIFDATLARPGFALMSLGCGIALVMFSRLRAARRALRHRHLALLSGLIGMGTLLAALSGDGRGAAFGALGLAAASVAAAPLLRGAARRLSASPARARQAEALLLLAAFSGGGVFWWNPPATVRGFIQSRDEGVAMLKPLGWIQENVGRDEVVLASNAYGAFVSARTGRRVLLLARPGESEDVLSPEPARRARFYKSVRDGRPVARLAEHYAATHLLLGPGEAGPVDIGTVDPSGEETLGLSLVYRDAFDFRVFRFTKK